MREDSRVGFYDEKMKFIGEKINLFQESEWNNNIQVIILINQNYNKFD